MLRSTALLCLLSTVLISQHSLPVNTTAFAKTVDYRVSVNGPVARVEMVLTLINPGPRDAEYDLIYPLGKQSVATALHLSSGGKQLEGQVYAAEKAKRIYQAIVAKRRDPALLEHYGESMFRARVFPIPAKGETKVTLTYNMVLRPDGDLTRLHLPLTAFRRASHAPKVSIQLTIVTSHPISTLYSPTHDLGKSSTRESAGAAKSYTTKCNVGEKSQQLDTDLVLYFKARGDQPLIDVTILSERPSPKEDGYFVAVLNGIPVEDESPVPRDIVFVLDRSGSMKGEKIKQAKAAVRFLVERLRPDDRFNLVSYSNTVQVFESGLAESKREIIANALRFIDGVNAEGGTNIQEALKVAMGLLSGSKRLSQIVFLTDGLPTVGERKIHKICAEAKGANSNETRLIAFGVGYDVNASLLDRLAVQNSGMSEYVLPGENIEEKVPSFYSRMQTPVLIKTKLSFEGGGIHDMYPREVGDLYGGHQILLTGRYGKPGKSQLVITGVRRGKPMAIVVPFELNASARIGDQELIARIWASRKVGFLVDEIRLHGENKELASAIVEIGTRFGILTEYTSFLAADQTIDLHDSFANLDRAALELKDTTKIESGAHGVAQASNSKGMQRRQVVQTQNSWLGDDGNMVQQQGVQCVNGKAIFNKGGVWQDPSVPKDAKMRNVVLFSAEFFEMLDANPWLNRVIARSGRLNCRVGQEYIAFTLSE